MMRSISVFKSIVGIWSFTIFVFFVGPMMEFPATWMPTALSLFLWRTPSDCSILLGVSPCFCGPGADHQVVLASWVSAQARSWWGHATRWLAIETGGWFGGCHGELTHIQMFDHVWFNIEELYFWDGWMKLFPTVFGGYFFWIIWSARWATDPSWGLSYLRCLLEILWMVAKSWTTLDILGWLL